MADSREMDNLILWCLWRLFSMLDRGKASSYTEHCRSSREVELPGRVNGRLHHEAKEALIGWDTLQFKRL